ncbi:hypothetical protein [Chromobacterium violaceum]|uniref:hypothetical protein n=1 Tax=Chromobacterium violaceum TaxID=536 RepID=UPI001B318F12|nr:hypothetical protein [Chromobacterium violaceum]MBP4047279.1 hypothetical protein [Chromobacterium violaceum]
MKNASIGNRLTLVAAVASALSAAPAYAELGAYASASTGDVISQEISGTIRVPEADVQWVFAPATAATLAAHDLEVEAGQRAYVVDLTRGKGPGAVALLSGATESVYTAHSLATGPGALHPIVTLPATLGQRVLTSSDSAPSEVQIVTPLMGSEGGGAKRRVGYAVLQVANTVRTVGFASRYMADGTASPTATKAVAWCTATPLRGAGSTTPGRPGALGFALGPVEGNGTTNLMAAMAYNAAIGTTPVTTKAVVTGSVVGSLYDYPDDLNGSIETAAASAEENAQLSLFPALGPAGTAGGSECSIALDDVIDRAAQNGDVEATLYLESGGAGGVVTHVAANSGHPVTGGTDLKRLLALLAPESSPLRTLVRADSLITAQGGVGLVFDTVPTATTTWTIPLNFTVTYQ